MAKIPKGRIVLYVVLGVIVIALGVWIFTVRSKEAQLGKGRKFTTEDVPKFVRDRTRQVDRLQEDLARLSGPEVDQALQLLEQARQGLTEIQNLTDNAELAKKRDEILNALTEARKLKVKAKRGR
ncbi:MAG: hypothetical protein ABIK44_01240 [candidate division WOR-3 bacterium]